MSETSQKCAQCDAELSVDSLSALCPQCLLQIGFETQPADSLDLESQSSGYQPTFIPPTAEELAPQFPQLEILEVIGHGGMGVVYKARQKELDRIVALKILRPGISDDASFSERFQREARALARLNHPNIITVFDFGRRDALFYFIMEYVDGTNLRHLKRVGDLNPAEALNIVPQICSALQYAHDNGVVHRDIKPENILIGKDGNVRIADFGLAKLAGAVDAAPLTGTWQVMGTPHYMAPEQFEKPTSVDHRADIYSLGVVIYELLTGELPLGRFALPSQKVHVDVRLDEVVLRSLDKEPERRYQHVTEVATAVEQAAVPLGESRMGHARDWIRDKAATVSERAKGLREKSTGWKPRFNQLYHWLAERRYGLGTALMWCGTADVVLSGFRLGSVGIPSHDDQAFLAIMAMIAGVIAFFLGRQLRRNNVSRRLKTAGLFSVLPWFGFLPSMVVRVVLVVLGLLATIPESSGSAVSDDDGPDVVDRAVAFARSVWDILTLRILLFTVFGIVGWLGVCVATFGIANEFWYFDNVPSRFVIQDTSGLEVHPVSLAYSKIHIRSSAFGESRGLRLRDDLPVRDGLTVVIEQSGRRNSHFEVDFQQRVCTAAVEDLPEVVAMPLARTSIEEWMDQMGIDIQRDEVQQEIAHLYEVILLMDRTQGMCSRLSLQDSQLFATLAPGIRSIMQEHNVMRNGIIPVGMLLDSDLFVAPRAQYIPPRTIRAQSWAEALYMGGMGALLMIGLLRVVRILYQQLWKPAFVRSAPDVVTTRSRWRRCCISLAAAGGLAGLLMLVIHNEVNAEWNRSLLALLRISADLPSPTLSHALLGSVLLASLIAVCGLLARPLFRTVGWWMGFLGGALAVLVLPISWLTFPTGLAAWIVLTDSSVSKQFRSQHLLSTVEPPVTAI